MATQEIRKVGSEDVYQYVLGAQKSELTLEMNLQSSTFLKYGVNSQGGGAGTIDESLSIFWSYLLNGTANYQWATGCRPNSLKLSGKVKSTIQATMDLICQDIATPTSSNPLTTPTYATDPASVPWNFTDGAVTIAATGVDVTEIEVNFNRNLEEIYTLGSTLPTYLPPKNREIHGTLTIVSSVATNIAALIASTSQTIVWTLKTGTSVLTLSACVLTKLSSYEQKPTDVLYEKYAFTAKTAALT